MSFITGTSAEVLYTSIATGTQLNTFTSEANLMAALPVCIIPAGFFYGPQGGTGKALRVKAVGRLGTTSAPTFTWTLRLLTSTTWSAAGVAWSSAALTAGTTQTLAPWILDLEIVCRTLGAQGANTVLAALGEIRSPLGLASPFQGTIPANNTGFTASIDNSVSQYLFLSAACGTSNAANLIQLEMLKVYGEN
jgi:hypothetical protein